MRSDPQRAQQHVAPAVLGFFRSVALGQAVGGIRTNSGTLQVGPHPAGCTTGIAGSCASCLTTLCMFAYVCIYVICMYVYLTGVWYGMV